MLSKTERLILINQYEILRKMDDDEWNKDYYAQTIRALEYGFGGEYWQPFERLNSESLSQEDCAHAKDILEMFWMMEPAYDRLTPKPAVAESDVRFRGFDGNNESMYCAYVDFLRKNGQFAEILSERATNSHMRTMRRYDAMLARWKELGKPLADTFTAVEIEEVIKAGQAS
jgi:uncharacterized protein YfbU (UPF0304 family)